MTTNETSKSFSIGIGRRKSASARVKIVPGNGQITINEKTGIDYFNSFPQSLGICRNPLEIFESDKSYDIIINVEGGGLQGQTQAIQLAVANAVSKLDSVKRSKLRNLGLLTRDTRIKERKKYGLKKARKASQYSKR
jgi:small subunit ribosomal protein S9